MSLDRITIKLGNQYQRCYPTGRQAQSFVAGEIGDNCPPGMEVYELEFTFELDPNVDTDGTSYLQFYYKGVHYKWNGIWVNGGPEPVARLTPHPDDLNTFYMDVIPVPGHFLVLNEKNTVRFDTMDDNNERRTVAKKGPPWTGPCNDFLIQNPVLTIPIK